MAKKQMSRVECVFYGFLGAMAALAVFGFIMAFATALTNPVQAAELPTYRYEIMKDLPKEKATITKEVCDKVGPMVGIMKSLIDRNYGDDTIREKLAEAAMNHPEDTNGWIAFHMAMIKGFMTNMREWPMDETYIWMQKEFPNLTAQEYYNIFAHSKCMQVVGKTIKVIPVHRIEVKPDSRL